MRQDQLRRVIHTAYVFRKESLSPSAHPLGLRAMLAACAVLDCTLFFLLCSCLIINSLEHEKARFFGNFNNIISVLSNVFYRRFLRKPNVAEPSDQFGKFCTMFYKDMVYYLNLGQLPFICL